MNTAAYLVNLSPASAIDFKTPFEMRHQKPADYSRLRVFGCDAYALTPKEHRSKLDPKAMKCKFLGYSRGVKGYRLWSLEDCKMVVSRDVSFNEPRLLKKGKRSILSTDKGKSLEGKVQETRLLGETSLKVEIFLTMKSLNLTVWIKMKLQIESTLRKQQPLKLEHNKDQGRFDNPL